MLRIMITSHYVLLLAGLVDGLCQSHHHVVRIAVDRVYSCALHLVVVVIVVESVLDIFHFLHVQEYGVVNLSDLLSDRLPPPCEGLGVAILMEEHCEASLMLVQMLVVGMPDWCVFV